MRFLPSNPGRTVAEILLTVAIIGFVVYDLGGRSSVKPEASNVVLSFEAKKPSALPAAEVAPASLSSRFETADTFTACGNYLAASNPVLVSSGNTFAVQLGPNPPCTYNPNILNTNSTTNATTLAGILVQSGGSLCFTNIQAQGTNAGAKSGLLQMLSGSTLCTTYSGPVNPKSSLTFPLLLAAGPCPTFQGVNIPATTNCPYDASLSTTGAYSCAVSYATVSISGATYCALLLTVNGALILSSQTFTWTFGKDCSTFTVLNFQMAIQTATGISWIAVEVLSWQCSSITVVFRILGSNSALIAAAVASLLAAAAPGGALYIALGGITFGNVPTITIGAANRNRGYYPVPYCRYYPCPSTIPFNPSSSNPGLFALLTLLVIPVFIFVGLLIFACLPRAPVCEPVPVCPPAPVCPAPAPVVYYAEPCAMPCDPCAAAAPAVGCF